MQPTPRQFGGLAALAAVLALAVPLKAQTEPSKPLVRDDDRSGSTEPKGGKQYFLGIECRSVEDVLRAQLGLTEGQGIVAAQVLPDSPAAKAGIKQYDVLLTANDHPLKDAQALMQAVADSGDKEMSITLMRQGKKETVKVTPAPRPATEEKSGDAQPDRDALYWLLEEPQPGQTPAEAMRMRILRRALLLPPGMAVSSSLPDDVSVTIVREGKKPAKISVKKGDRSWETTADELDKLPEDIRRLVAPLLIQPPFQVPLEGPGVQKAPMPFQMPAIPPGFSQDIEKRFKELDRQLEEMQKAIKELKERQK